MKLDHAVGTQAEERDGYDGDVPGILALTKRDRRQGMSMLATHPALAERVHAEWRREMQCMLFLNMKAEIQILGSGERLGTWVDRGIRAWNEDERRM